MNGGKPDGKDSRQRIDAKGKREEARRANKLNSNRREQWGFTQRDEEMDGSVKLLVPYPASNALSSSPGISGGSETGCVYVLVAIMVSNHYPTAEFGTTFLNYVKNVTEFSEEFLLMYAKFLSELVSYDKGRKFCVRLAEVGELYHLFKRKSLFVYSLQKLTAMPLGVQRIIFCFVLQPRRGPFRNWAFPYREQRRILPDTAQRLTTLQRESTSRDGDKTLIPYRKDLFFFGMPVTQRQFTRRNTPGNPYVKESSLVCGNVAVSSYAFVSESTVGSESRFGLFCPTCDEVRITDLVYLCTNALEERPRGLQPVFRRVLDSFNPRAAGAQIALVTNSENGCDTVADNTSVPTACKEVVHGPPVGCESTPSAVERFDRAVREVQQILFPSNGGGTGRDGLGLFSFRCAQEVRRDAVRELKKRGVKLAEGDSRVKRTMRVKVERGACMTFLCSVNDVSAWQGDIHALLFFRAVQYADLESILHQNFSFAAYRLEEGSVPIPQANMPTGEHGGNP